MSSRRIGRVLARSIRARLTLALAAIGAVVLAIAAVTGGADSVILLALVASVAAAVVDLAATHPDPKD